MSYEPGKKYNTEKGGVVGPVRASDPTLFGVIYLTVISGNEDLFWKKNGSPATTKTEMNFGSLTTEYVEANV